MVFSSPIFLFCFLPITLLLAWLSHKFKFRNSILLILSILFYVIGEGELIFLMMGSITMNYFIGKWIGINKTKIAVSTGIILNILLLVIFKYTSFIIENLNYLLAIYEVNQIPHVNIKLPVGISFYTFQSISYLIDVYRKENEAQKSYVDLALYICLFPQLIAGPIVRYKDVASQLRERFLSSAKFEEGITRFIIGLGKKVILANTLASCADQIFSMNPNDLTIWASWLGILCYSMQLYFDFSGYSDMAIGLGKMLGFDFMENFNKPYTSKSIREFWQRWHISLSNWFRDYLYIPLGGNRASPARVYTHLLIVFFLTGLWHGASWNFVIWGMIHGSFMLIERIGFGNTLKSLPNIVRQVYTLLVVVVAWVFFRAENLEIAFGFLKAMIGLSDSKIVMADMLLTRNLILAFIVGAIMSLNGFNKLFHIIKNAPILQQIEIHILKTLYGNVKSAFLILIFAYCSLSVAAGSYSPFIYFRF